MTVTDERPDDFWWLPDEIEWQDLAIEVGHHEPLHEQDDRPAKFIWQPGKAKDVLAEWRQTHENMNVYRKLEVRTFADEAIIGPIVLDIDCEQVTYDENRAIAGITNDLNEARRAAVSVWQRLESTGIAAENFRAYFSGRKGFHF